jgi:hypothetical protein
LRSIAHSLSLSSKRLKKSAFIALTEVSLRDGAFFGSKFPFSKFPVPYLRTLAVSEELYGQLRNLTVVLRGCKETLRLLDLRSVRLSSFEAFEALASAFPPTFPALTVVVLPTLTQALASETRVVRDVFHFFTNEEKFPVLSQVVAHHMGGTTALTFILPPVQPSMRYLTLPTPWIPSFGSLDLINFGQLNAVCFPDRRITTSRIMEYLHGDQLRDLSIQSKLFRASMHTTQRNLFSSILALQAAVEVSDPASYIPLVTEENVSRAIVLQDPLHGLTEAHLGFAFALHSPVHHWNGPPRSKNADLLKLLKPHALVYERHNLEVHDVSLLMRRTLAPFSVVSASPTMNVNCIMAFGIPRQENGKFNEPDLQILHHLLLPNHNPPQSWASNKALLDESKYALEQKSRAAPIFTGTTWVEELGLAAPADAMRDPDSKVTLLMLSVSSTLYPRTGFLNVAYNAGSSLSLWLLKYRKPLGIDVNQVDYKGNSAMHYACDTSSLERITELFGLLEAEGDIALPNDEGIRPFQLLSPEFFTKSPDIDPELERLFFKFIFQAPYFNPKTRSGAVELVSLPMIKSDHTPLLLTVIGYNYPLFSALLDRLPPVLDWKDFAKLKLERPSDLSNILRTLRLKFSPSPPFFFVVLTTPVASQIWRRQTFVSFGE